MFHWFCGLYVHLFDKVQEKEAKYHPLTRSACRRSLVKISYSTVTSILSINLSKPDYSMSCVLRVLPDVERRRQMSEVISMEISALFSVRWCHVVYSRGISRRKYRDNTRHFPELPYFLPTQITSNFSASGYITIDCEHHKYCGNKNNYKNHTQLKYRK